MRKIHQIASISKKYLFAVCTDGTLWRGDVNDDVVTWTNLPTPPDGAPNRKLVHRDETPGRAVVMGRRRAPEDGPPPRDAI